MRGIHLWVKDYFFGDEEPHWSDWVWLSAPSTIGTAIVVYVCVTIY